MLFLLLYFFFFVYLYYLCFFFFFFSSRRRHTRFDCDWSSDVCSSDLSSANTKPALTVIAPLWRFLLARLREASTLRGAVLLISAAGVYLSPDQQERSEERRVGKECRSRWSPYH